MGQRRSSQRCAVVVLGCAALWACGITTRTVEELELQGGGAGASSHTGGAHGPTSGGIGHAAGPSSSGGSGPSATGGGHAASAGQASAGQATVPAGGMQGVAGAAAGSSSMPPTCAADREGGEGGEGGVTALPRSCLEVLAENPGSPSGIYAIRPTAYRDTLAYCDMTTDGGGWTRISYPDDNEDSVRGLAGVMGRQMLKCSLDGDEHIISPPATCWSWEPGTFVRIAGDWLVNGTSVWCGDSPEYTDLQCSTWFGVGCGNGGGETNKLFPGVSDVNFGTCASRTTAHTNGAFTICDGQSGPQNYAEYVVFVRQEP